MLIHLTCCPSGGYSVFPAKTNPVRFAETHVFGPHPPLTNNALSPSLGLRSFSEVGCQRTGSILPLSEYEVQPKSFHSAQAEPESSESSRRNTGGGNGTAGNGQ